MTAVMVLSDGYIGNACEPWKLPDINELEKFTVKYHTDPEGFHPFKRDPETLARVWAKPGTPGLLHRIGGIEKDYYSGHISYDAANHQKMTDVRADKIAGIANDIPLQSVSSGNDTGKLAVVGWGSTRGAIHQAVKRARTEDIDVSHIHIGNIWPLPRNLEEVLGSFDKVIVAEMNKGQMNNLLRAEYLLDGFSLTKVSGQPFKITEILDCIREQAGEAK
jgi:2-oxoglutarate ferredoxin oxidoreductase subunit alpha